MSNTFKDQGKHRWKDRIYGEYDEWDKNKSKKKSKGKKDKRRDWK